MDLALDLFIIFGLRLLDVEKWLALDQVAPLLRQRVMGRQWSTEMGDPRPG